MSLLSRRKPISGSKRKEENEASLSKRKVMKPRKFQISNTTLEFPVLGGEERNCSIPGGTFSLVAPSSVRKHSSQASASADSKPSSLFTSLSAASSSAISSISSTGSLYSSDRSKIAENALASSKLSTLSASGPLEAMPAIGRRQMKRNRKHERSLTKGSAWFNMAKVEVTKEKKNDLEALKLRSAMDGVLHYKRNHMTHTPKYFHVGTVVETPADFYSSRIPKKQRKTTLAQEFAADYGME